MPGEILLSTAYLPPCEYFSLISQSGSVLIEREENYIKQTWRNRCRILTSAGVQIISVPVMKGNLPKATAKDVEIDYSKRWKQVHLRALISSYGRSPYFQFYFDTIEKTIECNHKYLIDLNQELLEICLEILGISKPVTFTSSFEPAAGKPNDFRYSLTPKRTSGYIQKPYLQVFSNNPFTPALSILDLIFNMGPDSCRYI